MPSLGRCLAISAIGFGSLLAPAGATPGGAAQHPPAASHAGHELGRVEFPVSCNEAAREAFEHGVALLHHMTYPRAREAFLRAARIEPGCAMARWGVAMTLFQPLWPTRPGPAELRQGWAALEEARALELATERERLWLASAEAFFRDPEAGDYWARIGRWEESLARLHAAFPDDPEGSAFYALALLAVAPTAGAALDHAERAAELLLAVHERNPEHPGAMHYLVHASDAPGRERTAYEIVRRYESLAPRNPHALHMPTHIYTRLGDWDGVVRGNLLAAEAALEHAVGEAGDLVWDEFPHAIEYLVYAYLQQGDDEAAARELRRLHETPRLEPSFKTAFHLASTSARYAVERRDWTAAAAAPVREPATLAWDQFPWPEAVSWFARGLGAARQGRAADARPAALRLGELERAAAAAGEDLFARSIRVLRLAVEGWIAHASGDPEAGEALLREAAELEAATPKHAVTPGPTLPAQEQLGDLLLEQSRPVEALAAFRRSLELYPRRFNGLLGAARAAAAAGDEVAAGAFYAELVALAERGNRREPLAEAGSFLAGDRPETR